MPIRDMDMYATWQRRESHSQATTSCSTSTVIPSSSQGVLDDGVGVPVGSNRGASGIDGVLSTAAGFAAGLKRCVTLTVGDVSFLHDINGLNLLRTGVCVCLCAIILGIINCTICCFASNILCSVALFQCVLAGHCFVSSCWSLCSPVAILVVGAKPSKMMYAGDMQPPLTVVLINNGGGGIFSFLPIADAVMPEVFTPLWATPQNVDLAGVLSLLTQPLLTAQKRQLGAYISMVGSMYMEHSQSVVLLELQ